MLAILAGPFGKYIGYGLLILVVIATIAGVRHELAAGQAAIKTNVQIQKVSAATDKAVAVSDAAVVKADTAAQTAIVVRYKTLKQKVPVYVTRSAPCIPWGSLRLHDAAVEGVDPGSLPLPPGATNDTCSTVAPSDFVATVLDNYATAEANAKQLDDLIAAVKGRAQAVAAQAPATPIGASGAAAAGGQPAGGAPVLLHPSGVLGHSDGAAGLPPVAVASADPPL